jgi:hypothetical protein
MIPWYRAFEVCDTHVSAEEKRAKCEGVHAMVRITGPACGRQGRQDSSVSNPRYLEQA